MGSALFAVLSWYKGIDIKQMSFLIPSEEIYEELAGDDCNMDKLIDNIVQATNMFALGDNSAFDEDYVKINDSQQGFELLLQRSHLLVKSFEKKRKNPYQMMVTTLHTNIMLHCYHVIFSFMFGGSDQW